MPRCSTVPILADRQGEFAAATRRCVHRWHQTATGPWLPWPLAAGGHLVTAVAEDVPELAAAYEAAGMRFSGVAVDPDPVALRGLAELVERGELRVHVEKTFPFERVADAHRLLDAGHLRGKLVLTV